VASHPVEVVHDTFRVGMPFIGHPEARYKSSRGPQPFGYNPGEFLDVTDLIRDAVNELSRRDDEFKKKADALKREDEDPDRSSSRSSTETKASVEVEHLEDAKTHVRPAAELPWPALAPWRRNAALVGILAGLFLSTLDSSIVATALVSVIQDFGSFDLAPWIVLAYMLTYMSFAMAFGSLSDIFGRKRMVMLAWSLFLIFSLACGVAQSIIQL
jgi:Arc/MetJ-type ribon-helix-helix transcriptional regulator